MAIRYTLVSTQSGAASGFPGSPAGGAAQTSNFGFNVPGGPLESLIFRLQGTLNGAGDLTQDIGGAISSLRVITNGETCFDHRSGYTTPGAATTCSQFTYFMNSIGHNLSNAVAASATVVDAYIRCPLGRSLAQGISRIEYTLATAALAAQATVTSVEVWCVYNDNFQSRTTVPAATSVTVGAGQQEVSVRMPANEPGVIAGVMVQNQDATDTDITSLRVISQSYYSIGQGMWRFLNSDLFNGVMYTAPNSGDANDLIQMKPAQICPGGIFIPTFGLSRADELRMQITIAAAGAGNVLLFTPVLVASASAQASAGQTQTQAVRTNTSAAILDISGAADA